MSIFEEYGAFNIYSKCILLDDIEAHSQRTILSFWHSRRAVVSFW